MVRKKHIVRYTTEELADLIRREGTASDWKKAAAMTKSEIEASVAADADEADMVIDWDSAAIDLPKPKAVLNMRIDQDILDFFRKTGKGYQTRINAILRTYVERQERQKPR